jgi:hypothetical protein
MLSKELHRDGQTISHEVLYYNHIVVLLRLTKSFHLEDVAHMSYAHPIPIRSFLFSIDHMATMSMQNKLERDASRVSQTRLHFQQQKHIASRSQTKLRALIKEISPIDPICLIILFILHYKSRANHRTHHD